MKDFIDFRFCFVFLFFAQISFSQTYNIKQLLNDGEKAFFDENFILAKEIFKKTASLDPKNNKCWYDLAVSELKLGENDNACEHFYEAFLRFDEAASESLKEYCPNYNDVTIMLLADVEEKPKFIYQGQICPLFENDNINPDYLNVLKKRLEKSKILKLKARGKVNVVFQIGKFDNIDIKVLGVNENQKKLELIEKEVISVFNDFSYISARNKGINVDLWNKWSLPLNFIINDLSKKE